MVKPVALLIINLLGSFSVSYAQGLLHNFSHVSLCALLAYLAVGLAADIFAREDLMLTFVYALSPTNLIAVLLAFSFGPPIALRDLAQDTLLQVTVDDGMRGRVYALRNMLRNVVFTAAGLTFAWLADFVGVRQIYMVARVLYVGTGLYTLWNWPLRESKLFESVEESPAYGDSSPAPYASDIIS